MEHFKLVFGSGTSDPAKIRPLKICPPAINWKSSLYENSHRLLMKGRWGCSLSILVANIWRLPLSLVVYIQRGERKKDSLFHKSNKNIIKI